MSPVHINFRHQAVRDLAWVIGSAGMLQSGATDRVSDSWCRIAFLDRIPWLRHLDNQPGELNAWLEAHQSRLLGYYFEALIAFWLGQWPRMRLLASRLPVPGEEKVIGEFDFLFHDRYREETLHWECTVKFFLRERRGGHYAWLGPNPRDTFANKYRKVFDRQLRLSLRPEAQPLLQGRGIAGPSPQAFFKGYLFYPAQSDWQRPQAVPPDSSPRHLKGWWCRADRLEQIPYVAADSRWLVLERQHWLSPVLSREEEPGLLRAELEAMLWQHFARTDRPLLLAELRQGGEAIWREVSRGFVVPAHWPHRKRRG
jgi:hypothetical protein